MSNLQEDLDKDLKELGDAYDKKNVIKGLTILAGISAEIAGLVAVIIAAMSAIGFVTGGLGYLGIPIAAASVNQIIRLSVPKILEQYSNLNKSDRKAVRMALKFLGVNPHIFG